MPNDVSEGKSDNQDQITVSSDSVQDSNDRQQLNEQTKTSEYEAESQLNILIDQQEKIIVYLEEEKADRVKLLDQLEKIKKADQGTETNTSKIESRLSTVMTKNQENMNEKISGISDQINEGLPLISDQAKASNTNLKAIDSTVASIAVSADPVNEVNTMGFLADGAVIFLILAVLPCYFVYRILKSQFALLNHIY